MKLLVLDLARSSKDLKQVLSNREWNCQWLTEAESENLCDHLLAAGHDSEIILVLDKAEPIGDDLIRKVKKKHPQVGVIHNTQSCLDLHSLVAEIEDQFEMLEVNKGTLPKVTSLDPRMFKSIDLYHVIDRMFALMNTIVSCEDIHWIADGEMDHFLGADLEHLKLELDVDYKRSHRLKSMNEKSSYETVKWLRKLPFHKVDCDQVAVLCESRERHLWLPLKDQGKTLGYLLFKGLEDTDLEALVDQLEEPLKMICRFLSFSLQMWQAQSLAVIDDLTELHNQRYLPRVLDREMARASRLGKKFTVMFLDVDYFKKVNDTNGHWVGSHLLIELAKIFKKGIRTCDYAFRYGGDEFVLILVDSDADSSQVVAERLRKQVESTPFEIEGRKLQLTVSIGLACYPDHAQTRQDIIELADQAMYYGKNKSRNTVYVAS